APEGGPHDPARVSRDGAPIERTAWLRARPPSSPGPTPSHATPIRSTRAPRRQRKRSETAETRDGISKPRSLLSADGFLEPVVRLCDRVSQALIETVRPGAKHVGSQPDLPVATLPRPGLRRVHEGAADAPAPELRRHDQPSD